MCQLHIQYFSIIPQISVTVCQCRVKRGSTADQFMPNSLSSLIQKLVSSLSILGQCVYHDYIYRHYHHDYDHCLHHRTTVTCLKSSTLWLFLLVQRAKSSFSIRMVIKDKRMASQQSLKSSPSSGSQALDSFPLVATPSQGTITRTATPQTSDLGNSMGTRDKDSLVECSFNCGPPRPMKLMVNIGTSMCPYWTCSSCNGAKKAIEHQANKNPTLKLMLRELKKNDPGLWRSKVRSCRISDPNDPPGTTGVICQKERTNFINEFRSSLIQRGALQDVVKRAPMNKSQFMAHLRFKEGLKGHDTDEQQDKHWAKVLASPDTKVLSGQGDTAVILVDKRPEDRWHP